jgi:hypothetical protein
MDYGAPASAFNSAPDMPGDKRLRIIIAAPHRGDLPRGRNGDHYGQSPQVWNPYSPDSVEPLAEHAVVLARREGFRPELDDLYEQADDLMREAVPAPGAPGGRATSLLASQGVPSLGDVTATLKDAMRHAARQYLKYAQGHPPGAAGGGIQATSPLRERSDG